MNSLNALGNRQVTSLQHDLSRMETGEAGPSVQGQITTTLAALSRLIDDYDSMARKEMVTAAREKANTRVAKLTNDHKELKARFERAKNDSSARARNDLLGVGSATGAAGSPNHSGGSLPHRRVTSSANGPPSPLHESPFGNSAAGGGYMGPNAREDYALREHSFIRESENNIDQYIAQGRAVLENLVEQRGILKGTRTRLLDAANTLGLSRETISWVERRTKEDKWIFIAGGTFTLASFAGIYYYFG